MGHSRKSWGCPRISVEWDHIHRKEGTLWSPQDLKRILNAVTYGGSPVSGLASCSFPEIFAH